MVPVHYATETLANAPIREAVTKIGGTPVFLEPLAWPLCRQCGRAMQFLIQIDLHQPLRLSDAFSLAYVFMCPQTDDPDDPSMRDWSDCETWDAQAGANAVLVQGQRASVANTVMDSPAPSLDEYDLRFEFAEEPNIEAVIVGRAGDDSVLDAVSPGTKVGGVPLWIQYPEAPSCPSCTTEMRFVAQLSYQPDFLFGDCGYAYVFLCTEACGSHGAAMLWQS